MRERLAIPFAAFTTIAMIFPTSGKNFIRAFIAAALLATARALCASDAESAAISEKDATKVLMQDLDDQFERLEKLQGNAPTQEQRIAEQSRLAALKERGKDLRLSFNRASYETLKKDLSLEHELLAKWVAPQQQAPESPPTSSRPLTGTVDNPLTALPATNYSPQVRAVLISLETDLRELDEKVERMPSGGERDAARRRVRLLHDRSLDLAHDFKKDRFDTLRNDVKAEWNTLSR